MGVAPYSFGAENFSKFLPYRSFDPDTRLFHNEETSGFVLRARPMVGAHLSDQENLSEFFRRREFLKEGTSMQFLLWANPKCEPIFEWWKRPRQEGLYKDLAHRRSEHLMNMTRETEQGLPLVRDYQLFISFTVPYPLKNQKDTDHLLEIRDQLREKLRTLGVPTETMTAQDFVSSFGEIITLQDTPTTPFCWNRFEDISKQLMPANASMDVKKEHVLFNSGYAFRAFVPKTTPPEWSLVLMDKFLGESDREGLDFPYFLHYGLTICDKQPGERRKGIAKRESLEHALKSSLGKFIPELKDQYQESLEMVDELQRGEHVCVASLSIGILQKEKLLDRSSSRLTAHLNRLNFEFVPTTYTHLPMFLSYLPMTWSAEKNEKGAGVGLYNLGRAKKTITREAQNLLPLLGEWTGQNVPGIPLVGRQGQIFFWNPYGGALISNPQGIQTSGNYNVCVSGQSGSGKSVLLQEMANNVLSVGGRVFIFDYGRSFEKYAHLLKGQHITFDIGNPVSLNPFSDLPEGDSSADIKNRAECLACIIATIKVMASHTETLGDLEASYIEEAVDYVAREKGRDADINDVRKHLLSKKERVAKNVGQMLYAYSDEGAYGKFFSGEAQYNLNEKLIVIETDDLRNHPSLMSVCVQMMIIRINQMILQSDRKFPFMIIIDEAWQLLSGKGSAEFIPAATRTVRKYGGSIVLATQLLTDYFQDSSPAATAAFNTSNWKIIMNQTPDSIEYWAQHPQLREYASSEALIKHMKSIHTRPPYYAEMAIFNEHLKAIPGRLMLDPFSRILYSTNANEFRLVQEFQQEGLSITDAIERVVASQRMAA